MTDEEKWQRLNELIELANKKNEEYNQFIAEAAKYQQMLVTSRMRTQGDLEQSPPRLKQKIAAFEQAHSPEKIRKQKELDGIMTEIKSLQSQLEGETAPDMDSPAFLSVRRRLF